MKPASIAMLNLTAAPIGNTVFRFLALLEMTRITESPWQMCIAMANQQDLCYFKPDKSDSRRSAN